jgi:hypothetical protein
MRLSVSLTALLILLNSAVSLAQAPNRLDVVERVTREDPARFACAHSGRPCEADWIKAVASALHATDEHFGLNMKRDSDSQGLSLDVVTWRVGPTDRHVLVFDICGACGSSAARPVWNEITVHPIGAPGSARWVKPAGTVPPVDPVDPVTPPADLAPVLAALATLTQKVDAVAALALAARDAALDAKAEAEQAKVNASDVKHVEIPKVLEALKGGAIPCLVGRVPKTFGGSAEVTFCPVP